MMEHDIQAQLATLTANAMNDRRAVADMSLDLKTVTASIQRIEILLAAQGAVRQSSADYLSRWGTVLALLLSAANAFAQWTHR